MIDHREYFEFHSRVFHINFPVVVYKEFPRCSSLRRKFSLEVFKTFSSDGRKPANKLEGFPCDYFHAHETFMKKFVEFLSFKISMGAIKRWKCFDDKNKAERGNFFTTDGKNIWGAKWGLIHKVEEFSK